MHTLGNTFLDQYIMINKKTTLCLDQYILIQKTAQLRQHFVRSVHADQTKDVHADQTKTVLIKNNVA